MLVIFDSERAGTVSCSLSVSVSESSQEGHLWKKSGVGIRISDGLRRFKVLKLGEVSIIFVSGTVSL